MKDLIRIMFLNFIPTNKDLGLLVLRIVFGAYMLIAHGWPKFTTFSEKSSSFPDPLGVGSFYSLVLVVAFEVAGSILIMLGLFTRLSALVGMITMGVAFFIIHKGTWMGNGNGELAFTYLTAYAALFIAGAGRYALEANMGAKT